MLALPGDPDTGITYSDVRQRVGCFSTIWNWAYDHVLEADLKVGWDGGRQGCMPGSRQVGVAGPDGLQDGAKGRGMRREGCCTSVKQVARLRIKVASTPPHPPPVHPGL